MRLTSVLVLLLALTACPGPGSTDGGAGGGSGGSGGSGGNAGGGAGGGDPNATLQTLTVTPSGRTFGVGGKLQFTATGAYSDSTMRDVSAMATWSTSASATATVSSTGLVTTAAEGMVDVIATFEGKTAQTTLTVSGVALTKIEIVPGMPNLGIGATQGFVATGTYFDMSTANITDQVTWSSSTPATATVAASGAVTAVALGTTTLEASLDGVKGSTTVTVTAKKLASISIAPPFIALIEGTSSQLTVTGTYTDGTTGNVTSSVIWDSPNTDNGQPDGGALVPVDGGFITARVQSSGASVYAYAGVLTARSIVRVTSSGFALTGITAKPMTMEVGNVFFAPQVDAIFTGVGQNYSFVTWTSSNTAVAKFLEDGRLAALSAGTSTLTATTYNNAGPLTSSATLTVTEPMLQSLTVSAGASSTVTLAQGATLQLSAMGVYNDTALNKDMTSTVTWSSSNTAAITIDATGLARGVGAGTSTLTARSGTVMSSVTVTVPSTTPPMQMAMLSPTDDNTVFFSGTSPSAQTMAYPVNALFADPGIAVGCSWLYSPPIGFAPERIAPLCAQALVKFDLSALAGKTILSAKLRLTTKVYGVGYVPRRWYLHALASQWTSTVNWNTASSFLHYRYSEVIQDPPRYSGQVFELDQTTTVRSWISGAYLNAGWDMGTTSVLFPAITSSSLDAFEWYSKEDPGGRGPKLIVQYQ